MKNSVTLSEAQRFYGHLVPWQLDSKDLKIINKIRNSFTANDFFIASVTSMDNLIKYRLWNNAEHYDKMFDIE